MMIKSVNNLKQTNNAVIMQNNNKNVSLSRFKLSKDEEKQNDSFVSRKNKIEKSKQNGLSKKIIAGLTILAVTMGTLFYQILPQNEKEGKEFSLKNKHLEDKLSQNLDSEENNPAVIEEIPQSVAGENVINELQQEVSSDDNLIEERTIPDGTFSGILTGKEDLVENLCNKYDVEPKFVAALIGAETGWGESGVSEGNNPLSYRASGDLGTDNRGFGIFSSVELGLETGIENIASYKTRFGIESIDIDHVEDIGKAYCSDDYNHWVELVRSCYNSI